MPITYTLTDPTPDEMRQFATMLRAALGEFEVKLVERSASDSIKQFADAVTEEVEQLAAEQARDLAIEPNEPSLSEMSAAIMSDPSVFTQGGAPSTAVAAPPPTVPEVPQASSTVPPVPTVPVPPPVATVAAPSAPATPTNVALDAKGMPWDARIHSSSKEKVKAGTWKYRRGVDDDEVARVEAELRQLMAVPAPAPAAPAPAIPTPPAALPGVVQAMGIINPLIAARKVDTPAVLAKLVELGLKSPADFNARPDLLPAFQQWAASL